MVEYSYALDRGELARYDAMAARAVEHEAGLWDTAGITTGAAVVDLGCGPGAFLAVLATRTAPSGTVAGVDAAGPAVAAARALAGQRGLGGRVRIVHAAAQHTGLEPASFDVVFIRNLLVHNGPGAGAILSHARRLLRPGGHLLCAEPDITGLRFTWRAAAEQELEQRWIQMMRSMGNDPGLGAEGQLAALLPAAGFIPDRAVHRVDPLDVERSPAWTARQMMLDKGFATHADIARWDTAITARLRDAGLLACRLPVTAVVAHPAPARRPAPGPQAVRTPAANRLTKPPARPGSRIANRHPQIMPPGGKGLPCSRSSLTIERPPMPATSWQRC